MNDIKRIVCPIDFSPSSERALMQAAQMAKWYRCRVSALHVTPALSRTHAAATAAANHVEVRLKLDALVERARAIWHGIDSELCEGDVPAAAIVGRLEALGADFAVMGSHGRPGFKRFVLGSVTEAVGRQAPCPVLVVPSHAVPGVADHRLAFKHILCAVDFSDASVAALGYAMAMAGEYGGTLTALSVIEMPPELRQPSSGREVDVDAARAEAEADVLRRLRTLVPDDARTCCTVNTAVAEGGAGRQILREAERSGADVIVMGVHGRSKLDLLVFGSNTQEVLRAAHCPVLIVGSRPRAGLRKAS